MRVAIGTVVTSADDVEFVLDAERLGADSVWVPEVWGADALTPLAYLAARTSRIGLASGIVQLGARTPANLAMAAMSLQQLSGGRFRLGVGTSGPQVMEGWHGVRFTSPIAATRETIEIVRIVARGDKLALDGRVYQLPLPDGPGRSIRSMLPPTTVPIYVAALGPKNLQLTGELADGWLGNAFLPEYAEEFLGHLRTGAERAGRTLADLDLLMPVAVEVTDDVEEAAEPPRHGPVGRRGDRTVLHVPEPAPLLTDDAPPHRRRPGIYAQDRMSLAGSHEHDLRLPPEPLPCTTFYMLYGASP